MNVITVTSTADQGSGTLRSAITAAKTGDTIKFANNLAGKTITLTSGQLVIDKNLTIDGGNAPGLTVSGNNTSRVFQIERKKDATLKNLIIANGKTQGPGGGINTRHESNLSLINVQVNNNISELGGGIRVGHLAKATIVNSSFNGNDGTLTNKYAGFSAGAISHDESRGQLIIKGSSFNNNRGFNGGAIYGRSTLSFVVEDSIFRNNTAKNRGGGGAIFTDGVSSKGYSGPVNDGEIIIRGSRFEGNQADGLGGALFLWGYDQDRAILEDTVIIGNTAIPNAQGSAKGGAIWAKMGLDIRNVTFANNTATQQGGALWLESKLPANILNSTFSGNHVINDAGGAMFLNNHSTPVNITNSTIVNNTAGRANGALWFAKDHNVTLKNSIVAFNTAERDPRQNQVGFQAFDGGGNLEFSPDSRSLRALADSLVADPKLSPLKEFNGTLVHSLRPDSPAINAGVQSGAPEIDQRGFKRDNRVDIGAFESGASSSGEETPLPTPDSTPTPTPDLPISNPTGDSPMNNDLGINLALDFNRIAISADGNADPDDIGATPAGLAMLAQAGLQDSLAHYHVNSQVWNKAKNSKNAKMRESAFGSATRMGFDQDVFFDALTEYQADGPNNAATQHLAAAINASSANDQLLIIGAGPMEVIYQAVKLADPGKRAFVQVLSHSHINDRNTGDGSGHTRSNIEKLGVEFIDIRDQNPGFSTHKDFGPWSWMKNADPNWKWVYERMQAGGKADISDAGMVYYALTGDERGNIDKLKAFLNSSPSPTPNPGPPSGGPKPSPEITPPLQPSPTPEITPDPEPVLPTKPDPTSSQPLFTVALVDASTDEVVQGYEDLGISPKINLNTLDLKEFNLVARVNSDHPDASSVKSIKFESNLGNQIENVKPYALFGDRSGDFRGKALTTGNFTIKAKAYTEKGGKGDLLTSVNLDYTVVETEVKSTKAPTATPTSNPTQTVPSPNLDIGSNNSTLLKIQGSKGDDNLTGGAQNQKILGRAGNDILVGVDIDDALAGLGEQDILVGGRDKDIFALGNASKVFYDDGNANTVGKLDFAQINDFRLNQGDMIQLHGQASNYRLGASPFGSNKDTAIFLKSPEQDELIGIVKNGQKQNLSLNSNAFNFV